MAEKTDKSEKKFDSENGEEDEEILFDGLDPEKETLIASTA